MTATATDESTRHAQNLAPLAAAKVMKAEEIERESCRFCRRCSEEVDEYRVYFGVVGPFCNVACRDAYARAP